MPGRSATPPWTRTARCAGAGTGAAWIGWRARSRSRAPRAARPCRPPPTRRAGDTLAIAAFARAGEYVGRVLAGAIVLLWPERVVVGGGVADAGELLLGPLRDEVRRRACVAPVDRIAIVPAELGPHAGAVGAALWAAEAPVPTGAGGR